MVDFVRRVSVSAFPPAGNVVVDPEDLREWLVTNGLGGYASGTVSGIITRRFHGLLIAALAAPRGRTMMLNYLAEQLVFPDGAVVHLGAQERPAGPESAQPRQARLAEFRVEWGLPVWRYECAGATVEKRLLMPHRQNTAHVTYRLLAGDAVRIELQPWINFRAHEGPLHQPLSGPYALLAVGDRYEVSTSDGLPPLRLQLRGERASFTIEGKRLDSIRYQTEESRGYDASGDLYSPGYFRADLRADAPATLVASTEPWEVIGAMSSGLVETSEHGRRARCLNASVSAARTGMAAELVFAADQFIMTPAGRMEDTARSCATGDEIRSVIAGYHWFTDWGRDTMISLEGLALATGRFVEAGYILRTFAHYIHHGLIPNMFPEGNNAGLYHTADATLWFFHAIDRYLEITKDRETLRIILPQLIDIIDCHLRGTDFGIGVDPVDGLLRQGAPGYQLTWMDAKVGDYVVTPRRGKAVEINALFYNALRLLEGWLLEERGPEPARMIATHAERVKTSFNKRFWYEPGGHLYDVVDGEGPDDPAFRPNQIFAVALKHAVLDDARWKPVVDQVKARLLTPFGLRSLAPGHPDYKPKYFGDLRSRDMAYHQGTVWAWLIGPFVDAWLKVYPSERATARGFLEGFAPQLDEACVGSISEIFDAEPPYTPRGCIAQAWSVAEVLRGLVKTSG